LLERTVHQIRSKGLRVSIVVEAPAQADGLPRSRFQKVMQEAHWILAERLKPDLLVLYSQPDGADTLAAAGDLPASIWAKMIQDAVTTLQKGFTGQATAIELTIPLRKSRDIFMLLSQGNRGLDQVRFRVDEGGLDLPGVSRALIELGGWLARSPTHMEVSLAASPPTPLSLGGFGAQTGHLEKVLGFATGQPLVSNVCLGPMLDGRRDMNGFWDNRDQPRPCVPRVYELMHEISGAPIPGPGR
jgi:hypothetical protein